MYISRRTPGESRMRYYKLIPSKKLVPISNVTITCDDDSKEGFKKLMRWDEQDFQKNMEECDKSFALCTKDDEVKG